MPATARPTCPPIPGKPQASAWRDTATVSPKLKRPASHWYSFRPTPVKAQFSQPAAGTTNDSGCAK